MHGVDADQHRNRQTTLEGQRLDVVGLLDRRHVQERSGDTLANHLLDPLGRTVGIEAHGMAFLHFGFGEHHGRLAHMVQADVLTHLTDLLLEGHAGEEVLDAPFDALRGILVDRVGMIAAARSRKHGSRKKKGPVTKFRVHNAKFGFVANLTRIIRPGVCFLSEWGLQTIILPVPDDRTTPLDKTIHNADRIKITLFQMQKMRILKNMQIITKYNN